ncbi:MAG: hypothetical protein R2860_16545 [Desulfobacterales bacterium]
MKPSTSFSMPNNAITNNVDPSQPEKAFTNPKSDISNTDEYVASVTEFKGLPAAMKSVGMVRPTRKTVL